MAGAVLHVVDSKVTQTVNRSTQVPCRLYRYVHIRESPRDSWRTIVHKDLRALRVELKWYRLAQDRLAWRQLITSVGDPDPA